MPLTNCQECGKVYLATIGRMCPECHAKYERLFDLIKDYIRNHDKSSAQEIASALEVSQEKVLRFLREGRLIALTSATYPCELCGSEITTGRFCTPCREKMSRSLQDAAKLVKSDLENQGGYLTNKYKKNP